MMCAHSTTNQVVVSLILFGTIFYEKDNKKVAKKIQNQFKYKKVNKEVVKF